MPVIVLVKVLCQSFDRYPGVGDKAVNGTGILFSYAYRICDLYAKSKYIRIVATGAKENTSYLISIVFVTSNPTLL